MEKWSLSELVNFSLAKNIAFIFLNGVIEKMGIDFQRPADLAE